MNKFQRLSRFGAVLTAIALLVSTTLYAQTFFGSLVGTVTDSTSAVVPGVSIMLLNRGTNEKLTAITDERGNYQFVSLLPGAYTATFEHQGFKRIVRENIEVKTSTVSRIDAVMEVGAVETQVLVTAAAPQLDTQSSTVGALVEGRVVQETPLNGRNVMNLITLTPGVVAQGTASGSAMSNQKNGSMTQPSGWGNYQIGGGMSGQSAMFIDGQPLNGTQGNAPVAVPVQDFVQEFRVETNTVSPEFGRFAGGVVVMTSKEGSNSFHGTAYEYLRNNVLNANNWFNKDTTPIQPRPEWTQNQYGVNLGGRIIKDRAFFFAGWEGFTLRVGDPNFVNLPTTAQMNGDFSSTLGTSTGKKDLCGHDIYTGSLADPSSHIGCVFAGNQIPKTRWDSTGAFIIQNYYPQNTTGTWTGNGASGSDYNQIVVRADYNLGLSHRLFVRYLYWTGDTIAEDTFKNGYGKPGENHQVHMATIGDTYTINNKTIADLRLSYSGLHWDSPAPSAGKNLSVYGGIWPTLAPLENIAENVDPLVPGGPIQGYCMDLTQMSFDNILAVTGSFIRIEGRHTLKFGGEWRYTNFSNYLNDNGGGRFVFADTTSSSRLYTGNAWANLLLGLPTAGELDTAHETGSQMIYGGLYAMDTFQLNRKLTLNYGIRWEQPGAFKEHHDQNTVFLPSVTDTTAGVGAAGSGEPGLLALVNSSNYGSRYDQQLKWDLFVPRVGFAYRATNSIVIKGGFGMSLLPSNSGGSQSPITGASNSITPGNVLPSIYNPCNPTGTYLEWAYASWNPASGCARSVAVLQPTGRTSDASYRTMQYGTSISVQIPYYSAPTATQWNFTVGQDFGRGMTLQLGYVGAKGTHLPSGATINGAGTVPAMNINQLPDNVISQYKAQCDAGTCPLLNSTNSGASSLGQSLLPYPQYVGVYQNRAYWGNSMYHALQALYQKRLQQGTYIQAAYTWSKMMSDVDSVTNMLQIGTLGGAGGPQDQYNHQAERSVSTFNVPQHLTISYFLALPFGKGQTFGHDMTGVANKLISGWGLNGITNFQSGFPLAFTAAATNLSNYFNAGTPRPNITPGCNIKVSGTPQNRVKQGAWFNKACFTQPDSWGYGNARRVQSNLYSQGIDNWDLSAVKKTEIREGQTLEFRAEFFNIANKVRFEAPDTGISDVAYGQVTATASPNRVVQFALRYNF